MRTRRHGAIGVLVVALAACASTPTPQADAFGGCAAGQPCKLSGRLELYPQQHSVALLASGNACAKLLLPERFFRDHAQWDGVQVEVVGEGFAQHSFDAGSGVLGYAMRDRWVSLGACDGGIGVYVDRLRRAGGSAWTSP